MKTVIFCTNLPSPYRVDFFNELGKFCDLTVLYERSSSSERNSAWKGSSAETYKEVYLDLRLVGVDRSRGSALRKYVASHECDILVFTNYVSLATMEAIAYCRFKRIPYYLEYDGGFNKKDSWLISVVKKFLLSGAMGHLSTANEHITYLASIGIKSENIYKYPFTSISNSDIENAQKGHSKGKEHYRKLLGIKEEKVVLAVGQFIYRKGFDVLMHAATHFSKSIGVYIIGGEPTSEYILMKNDLGLTNVYFVGFKTKSELANYYQAADCTAFPTREDIWGLITNESMAFGVPVVATDRCISALEMIENGKNGYIVPVEDESELAACIVQAISMDMKNEIIRKAKQYTIETMVDAHVKHLNL